VNILIYIRKGDLIHVSSFEERLCGLVVRVLGYTSRGRVQFPVLPDFVGSSGSPTGPLGLMRVTQDLLE
jgi:hypothetical protein